MSLLSMWHWLNSSNTNLQRVLETVVHNGLKAGWLSLGHGEDDISRILPLVQPLPPSTATEELVLAAGAAEGHFEVSEGSYE